MKTLRLIQTTYKNCELLGIYNVFFQNSGWTITERNSLFFSYKNVTYFHFDKILKTILLNEELFIETVCFEILDGKKVRYIDYTRNELLKVL